MSMNYILEVQPKEMEQLRKFYEDRIVNNNNQYVLFHAKDKAISVTAYTSGKVMFQGVTAKSEYEAWLAQFQTKTVIATIGSDEVGTGDFFGPIIVVAAYLPEQHIDAVKKLGVGDSKKISDDTIISIAKELKHFIVHKSVILNNHYYNKMYAQYKNLNKIKAVLHNRALVELTNIRKADQIIVDQFCDPKHYFNYLTDQKDVFEDIHFETKAESKYLAVAAASILARFYFLEEWIKLENQVGELLPKGASSLVDETAARLIQKHGIDYLNQCAKMNFKNLNKAINLIDHTV